MFPLTFKVALIFIQIFRLTRTIDDDENFYYLNNNKYFYNKLQNCQLNHYFDLNFFKCRLCDENFNLIASPDSK